VTPVGSGAFGTVAGVGNVQFNRVDLDHVAILGLPRQFSGLIVAGLTLPAAAKFKAHGAAPLSFPRLTALLGTDSPAQHHHCAQGEVE